MLCNRSDAQLFVSRRFSIIKWSNFHEVIDDPITVDPDAVAYITSIRRLKRNVEPLKPAQQHIRVVLEVIVIGESNILHP